MPLNSATYVPSLGITFSTFGTIGYGPVGGTTLDTDGRLLWTDFASGAIFRADPNTRLTTQIVRPFVGPVSTILGTNMLNGRGLAFDSANNLYVVGRGWDGNAATLVFTVYRVSVSDLTNGSFPLTKMSAQLPTNQFNMISYNQSSGVTIDKKKLRFMWSDNGTLWASTYTIGANPTLGPRSLMFVDGNDTSEYLQIAVDGDSNMLATKTTGGYSLYYFSSGSSKATVLRNTGITSVAFHAPTSTWYVAGIKGRGAFTNVDGDRFIATWNPSGGTVTLLHELRASTVTGFSGNVVFLHAHPSTNILYFGDDLGNIFSTTTDYKAPTSGAMTILSQQSWIISTLLLSLSLIYNHIA